MPTFVRVVLIVVHCLVLTAMIKSQVTIPATGRMVPPSPELEERCRNSNYNPLYCPWMQPHVDTEDETGGLGLGGGSIPQTLEQFLAGGSVKVDAKFTYDKKPQYYLGYDTDQPWALSNLPTFPSGPATGSGGWWHQMVTVTASPRYTTLGPYSTRFPWWNDCNGPCFGSVDNRPQFSPQQAPLGKYRARIFGRPSPARPQDAKLQKNTVGLPNNTTVALL